MAARFYDIKLRHRSRNTDLDEFSRSIDLEDDRYTSEVDGQLRKLLISAVRAHGGRADDSDLHEYDLQLRERGRGSAVLTYRAAADE